MTGQQLKNSILQMAIQGKLVPQDPRDEPASELLQKIKAQKECLAKEGKIKSKAFNYSSIDEDEIPFEIPATWVWVRFGDISINRDSERIPLSVSEREKLEKIYDYYGASGVIDKVDRYLFDKPLLLIGEDGANLINRSTPIAFIATGKYWVNNHAHVLDYLNETLMEWVRIHINAISLVDYITGTAQPKMNQEKMNSIPIALPPIEEQKRIAAKLESLMPLIESYGKSQEALNALNASLPEKLRQSILQEAIQGHLVPQDPNEEPASVLLERIRAEKARLVKEGKLKKKDLEEKPISPDEIPFDIPEGWVWVRLTDIAILLGGYAFKSYEYTDKGSRVIRISDITPFGIIDKNIVRHPYSDSLSQFVIQKNDILMAMTGGTVGKSLLVDIIPEELMLLNQRVANIRPLQVNVLYIHYNLSSSYIQNVISHSKNSTNDNISMGDIGNFLIPLPPLSEQRRIVTKLEELLHEIDKLKG